MQQWRYARDHLIADERGEDEDVKLNDLELRHIPPLLPQQLPVVRDGHRLGDLVGEIDFHAAVFCYVIDECLHILTEHLAGMDWLGGGQVQRREYGYAVHMDSFARF